jgi:hypothetical protein
LFCAQATDPEGRLFLTDRSRYVYRELVGNRIHVVTEGDSLHHLAARYFTGIDGAANLFWVIADFQPVPIQDPTLQLEVGRVLVIPATRTVLEEILNPRRRAEFVG